MLVTIAYAADGAQAAAPGALTSILPLIIIFAIFYFLLIRPQQKKQKEHTQYIEAMKQGDEVLTSGGIYGKVVKVDGLNALVEIADKVKVQVVKSQLYPAGKPADVEKK